MIRALHNSFAFKCLTAFVGLSLLVDTLLPTAAWALTSGPTQPEMASFTPIGTSDIVNPFTGNMSWSTHLLTIPGPGGGYPVNLAYNAGPTLEEEASWVGLGFNVNAGSVNRQLRGLPDDFNGDIVTKEQTSRPNRTLSAEIDLVPVNSEFYGFDGTKINANLTGQLYYNNYRGMGYQLGANFSTIVATFFMPPCIGSSVFSYDSQTGLGVTPGFSYATSRAKTNYKFTGSATINSRQGIQALNFGGDRETVLLVDADDIYMNGLMATMRQYSGRGPGTSFASGSSVPLTEFPTYGLGFKTTLKGGGSVLGATIDKDVTVGYSESGLESKTLKIPSYGYVNSENANEKSLSDYNMERNVPVVKTSQVIPIPKFTYDVYTATAQGAGGTYRPYRSEIGFLRDRNVVTAPRVDLMVGPEADGGASEVKGGVNTGYVYSQSWSGDWFPLSRSAADKFDFKTNTISSVNNNTTVSNPYYEPAYFKATGEQTADQLNNSAFDDAHPYKFEIVQAMRSLSPKARIRDVLYDENNQAKTLDLEETYRNQRQKRSQLFAFKTWEETVSNPSDAKITYNGKTYNARKHIREIAVTNPDGRKFIYGEPVYNFEQKEVFFSVEHDYDDSSGDSFFKGDKSKLTQYKIDAGKADNSLDNKKGYDKFYSATKLPPYPTSHLLTQIVSSDYIDLTDDGPSPDDFGSWTRFGYTTHMDANAPYQWRAPYNHEDQMANFIPGNLSDPGDDKAAYSYGTKELKYLDTIETKTHIAYFYTSDREDGLPVASENEAVSDPSTAPRLQKLDKIELYKKKDPENPSTTNDYLVRTVFFEYSYDLCPGVENNSGSIDTSIPHPTNPNLNQNSNKGKLTLEKVYFINGDPAHNNVGELSPYVFDYHAVYRTGDALPAGANYDDPHPLYNPPYAEGKMDRWGNYQNDNSEYHADHENPFTWQQGDYLNDGSCGLADTEDVEARNAAVSAWSLRAIHLPSGGKMEIEYEADDYAYVEDKEAMQMLTISATGSSNGLLNNGEINGNNDRIYFKLNDPIASTDLNKLEKLKAYLTGIEQVYFKTLLRLKKLPAGFKDASEIDNDFLKADFAYDYVDGYAETEIDLSTNTGFGFGPATACTVDQINYHHTAYIQLKAVPLGNSVSAATVNPIQKAGFQYLQLQRPDLFRQPQGLEGNIATATQVVAPATQMVKIGEESARMLLGFNRFAKMSGYCKEIDLSAGARPSFIRLKSNKPKYGGGHRVKSLTLHDNWNSMSGEDDYAYTQEFSYVTEDGNTSGVASYEPLIGGEEIPHRTPVRYSSEAFIKRDRALYVENPIMESFYPAPVVGYARIVVKNKDREVGGELVSTTAEGIRVQEFYTARDYPTKETLTDLTLKPYNVPVTIPFVGSLNFNNRGVSQGFAIELNDMHGKPKAEAIYDYDDNPSEAPPISKTEYFYHQLGDYNPNGGNELNNEVQVLYGDGDLHDEHLGQTVEFYGHRRENYTFSQGISLVPNVTMTSTPPIAVPTVVPYLQLNEGLYRSIATTKIINKTGIVSHIRNTSEGAIVETYNKVYDAYNGKPLLTIVSNSYKDPIYNYEMPAHWYYSGMEPGYQNIGVELSNPGTQVALLHPGDVLLDLNNIPTKYWVESTDPLIIKDKFGNTAAPNGHLKIIQSGHRNQHTVPAGNLVSLEHPITNRIFPLFDAWNQTAGSNGVKSFSVTNCLDGTVQSVTTNIVNSSNELFFEGTTGGTACEISIQFKVPIPNNIGDYNLTLTGTKAVAEYQGQVLEGTYNDPQGCFSQQCAPGVLNATAVTFNDSWDYNYVEAGIDQGTATYYKNHPYKFGGKGVFRAEGSWVYQNNRQQTAYGGLGNEDKTNIREDGIYENFVLFNWLHPEVYQDPVAATHQAPWIKSNQINQYDPYGYEIEEEDALGNPSAALYGYGKTLPTAVGANLRFYELAFDGFEDYDANTYSAPGHGRLNFTTSSGVPNLTANEAHSGQASMVVSSGSPVSYSKSLVPTKFISFQPLPGKKYLLTGWAKPDGNSQLELTISATDGISPQTLFSSTALINYADQIEGWYRFTAEFEMVSGVTQFDLAFSSTGTEVYLDDVRIHPKQSAIKTFVYDPVNLWLVAELDAHNYATFYNYDLEGGLVQTKKETERGVMTLQNTRSHLRKTTTP
ncbi:MAG: hypothetical protein ACFB10_21960 [Salibacteraceae bacterium]